MDIITNADRDEIWQVPLCQTKDLKYKTLNSVSISYISDEKAYKSNFGQQDKYVNIFYVTFFAL